MMNSYLSLAWKEIKAQKVTSVLILIAMILSTTVSCPGTVDRYPAVYACGAGRKSERRPLCNLPSVIGRAE
ncbi:hypothetical protein [Sporofaciens sp. JLR.KK001]|uniref:hypothetical protein n=1 Tax=Sporofaciens sp. JLR.KK001 TaxID=3112621 RepID=UPI002FF2764B